MIFHGCSGGVQLNSVDDRFVVLKWVVCLILSVISVEVTDSDAVAESVDVLGPVVAVD